MTFDITDIIVAFIGLIGVVISTAVVPYIKAKVGNEQWESIQKWAHAAVMAAETLYEGTGMGEQKLQFVKEYIEKECAKKHIKVDIDTVRIAIENAWKMNGFDKHEETKAVKSTAKKAPTKADQK